MKFSTRILSLPAALFLIASPALGDDATNYDNSGRSEFLKGDVDGAIADYTKAIALNPDDADAYESRGWAEKERGDLDDALGDFNKVIDLKPDFADAYNGHGVVKLKKG